MSTNPVLEETNDVYTGLLALSKLFVQSNPKDTQQMHHGEWRRGTCTQNGYNTGTKGRTKSYHCMSCSPKQIFQKNWPSPQDIFAQEAVPPKKITQSRQRGTGDRWGPLQHLPSPQPKYHNLPWERPTELAQGISARGGLIIEKKLSKAQPPPSFLGAFLVHWRQLKLLSTPPASSMYFNHLEVSY